MIASRLAAPFADADEALRGKTSSWRSRGVEHTQKVSELGVRSTASNSYTHFPAHARSLCKLVLAESQLQPTPADLRGCLADGSHNHV